MIFRGPGFLGPRSGGGREWGSYWDVLSGEFGSDFPEDYKLLSERYGGFEVSQFIAVNSPQALVDQNRELQSVLSVRPWDRVQIREGKGFTGKDVQSGEEILFSRVVQWADTGSDFVLCWDASGSPDSWNILATDFYEWRVFSPGLFDFLEMIVETEKGALVCQELGWPVLEPSVVPFGSE